MNRDEGVYVFGCPECDEVIRVDWSMRDALVTNGCVICGARVTVTAFSERSSARTG